MMGILNSFSGNPCVSISLVLVFGDLFCAFLWAIPCFLMFYDTLFWCLHIWKTPTFPILYRLALYRGGPLPVSPLDILRTRDVILEGNISFILEILSLICLLCIQMEMSGRLLTMSLGRSSGQINTFKKYQYREFPGGPVVRTLCFHCWGPGSILGWGTKTLQAVQWGQKKKKERKKYKYTYTI